MKSLTFRFAQLIDYFAIARIESDALPYEVREDSFDLNFDELSELWYDRLSNKEFEVLVANCDNYDCGFVAYKFVRGCCFIQALYIDPTYFRKKVATRLITQLEHRLRSIKIQKIYLYVQKHNNSAKALYESLHFAQGQVQLPHLICMYKEL